MSFYFYNLIRAGYFREDNKKIILSMSPTRDELPSPAFFYHAFLEKELDKFCICRSVLFFVVVNEKYN